MLQIKCWSWDINQPKGYTLAQIQEVINKFLREFNCKSETYEMFMLDNGIMFARVMYTLRKPNTV